MIILLTIKILLLPTKDTPIPPDYVLGPGDDNKNYSIWKQNKKYTLRSNKGGRYVFLPEIGPVSIAGLTFQ